MYRLLMFMAAAWASGAPAALAAEGRFTYENRSSATVVLTSESGEWTSPAPRQLAPGDSGEAGVRFADGAVAVNHLSYGDPKSTRSCSFRIQTEPGSLLCRIVAVTSAGGGASCHYRFTARDSRTCDFSVVFTLSGF